LEDFGLILAIQIKIRKRIDINNFPGKLVVVVVVLFDPFRGMGACRNSTETQRSGHFPRSEPEVKNGRSGVEDGAPKRLGCGTVKEEVSQILQRVSAGAA